MHEKWKGCVKYTRDYAEITHMKNYSGSSLPIKKTTAYRNCNLQPNSSPSAT